MKETMIKHSGRKRVAEGFEGRGLMMDWMIRL